MRRNQVTCLVRIDRKRKVSVLKTKASFLKCPSMCNSLLIFWYYLFSFSLSLSGLDLSLVTLENESTFSKYHLAALIISHFYCWFFWYFHSNSLSLLSQLSVRLHNFYFNVVLIVFKYSKHKVIRTDFFRKLHIHILTIVPWICIFL